MRGLRQLGDGLRLVRPALRAERASNVALLMLVLVSAALAAAVPILLQRASDAGLREAVANASSVERNVVFTRQSHKLSQAGEPLAAVEAAGEELAAQLPPSIAASVVERQHVVSTSMYLARAAPQPVTHMVLRHQSGIDDHISYVEGSPPTGRTYASGCPPDGECPPGMSQAGITYEVALSRNTADALRLGVGDRLPMVLEMGVPPPRPGVQPTPGERNLGILITGIFEPDAPQADYWLGDSSLDVPNVQPVNINLANYYAAALVAPETYASLPALIPYSYSWRFRLDPQRIDFAALDQFERDLRRLQARFPIRPPGATFDTPSLATGLTEVLSRFVGQRAAALATLLVMGVGPLVAVLGSLGLVVLLWLQRREATLVYMRQRGAAATLILGRTLGEAALVVLPAAAAGYLAAAVLLGDFSVAAAVAAAVIAGLALAAVTLGSIPIARAAVSLPREELAGGRRLGLRRLVFEGLLVGLALIGAIVLAERDPGAQAAVDPYLAAVPALAGVAAGLALLRLYPLAAQAGAWLTRPARGLVGTHALRTAAREPGISRLPLLAPLLAVAMTVFASGVLVTLERAQLESSWRQVGADYRVEADIGDVIPDQLAIGEIDGVALATRMHTVDGAVSAVGLRRDGVLLQAIEPAEYERLYAGTPVEVNLPATFDQAWPYPGHDSPPTVGLADRPMPAVLYAGLAAEAGLDVGDTFDVTIPGGRVVARLDATAATLPGVNAGREFVIVPDDALRAAYPGRPLLPTLLLARGEPAAEPAARGMVEPFRRRVQLYSRPALYAQLHDAPLSRAISGGLGMALAVALSFGALALVTSSALALVVRRREMALLRTMGARRGQLVGLLIIGQLPGVVAALAAGLALGLGLVVLLLPILGLGAFSGPQVAIGMQLEPLHVALAVLLPAIVALALAVGGGWLLGRHELTAIIRGGEDQVTHR